jgi:hypothetical protein
MNQAEFSQLCEQTYDETFNLLKSKGQEYAGTEDRLSNFKRGANLTGTTPLQCCFIYMSKHYDALSTFIKKDADGFDQHLSEPIEGRINDLINYCLLMKGLIQESQNFKPKDTNPNKPF